MASRSRELDKSGGKAKRMQEERVEAESEVERGGGRKERGRLAFILVVTEGIYSSAHMQ